MARLSLTSPLFLSISYNVLILVITKYAGATMFTLAFAIRLPLTQIVYWIKLIMQENVEPFHFETIIALVRGEEGEGERKGERGRKGEQRRERQKEKD